MIELHSLTGKKFTLNSELIKSLETVPDTVITLTSSEKLLVTESPEEIVARIVEFRRKVGGPSWT